jgi:hypothetical protein
MSKADKTVRVREIPGEPFCFRVESWSDGREPHRVELLAHQGRGECSCERWGFKAWPALKAGASWYDPHGFCRHVLAARQFFLCRLLTHMSDDSRKPRA